MTKPVFKKNKAKPTINEVLEKKKSVIDADKAHNFRVSFQYVDTSGKYASSYKDWQKHGLLSKALETLQGYCCSPLTSQLGTDKFVIYGDFPHTDNTKFDKPNHVPPDAKWARIHVNGPAVLVGHIVNDTFYVVFLDKTHKFWLTKKYLSNKN